MLTKLNHKSARVLIDTGAARSCVSETLVNKLKLKVTKPSADDPPFLYTANRSKIVNLGTVDIDVCIQGLVIPFTFCVFRNIIHNCVIGMDFLNATQANVNFSQRILSLYDGLVTAGLITAGNSNEALLLLAKTVSIPPNTEAIVPVSVPPQFRSKDGLMEPWPAIKNKLIAVAPALIHPQGSTTSCRILNLGTNTRTLNQNTPIAVISSINLHDEHNSWALNRQKSHVFRNNISVLSAEIPESQETMLEALQKIGISFKDTKLSPVQFQQLVKFLYDNRDLFAEDFTKLPGSDLMYHEIRLTTDKPIRQKYFRQAPHLEKELQRQCDELLKAGIIEESDSPFSSPAFLVKKADGSYRKVVDYRKINAVTEAVFYPLPTLEDCIDLIGQESPSYFSLCDQRSGFWSLKLHPDSKRYTAFSTRNGHYQYTRLAMGLRNSPVSYMQCLSRLLRSELASTALLYLDDLILFNKTFDGHMELLRTVFHKFRTANLRMNAKKCRFCVDSLIFLGFRINQQGVSIDSSRFDAIKSYPVPKNIKQLRQYLGLMMYFKRFIKNHSAITAPLRRLLQKNEDYIWTDEHQRSFEKLKEIVLTETTLAYPRPGVPFTIWLDACKDGLGFCLSQKSDDGLDRFISFNGRATRSYERNYSASLLEVTALAEALKTYYPYIGGETHFTVKTDHLSLKYLNDLKLGPSRLVRYALLFAPYNFTIEHLPGKQNQLCDSLSRRYYEPEDERNTEPLLDMHPHDFLASIQVNDIIADNELDCPKSNKVKQRKLLALTLAPITTDEALETDANEDNVIDDRALDAQKQWTDNFRRQVNLDSQSDCPHFKAIIQYLMHGELPRQKEEARKIVIQSDNYFIENNQLYRMAVIRSKRLHKIRPAFAQLCVPRQYRLYVIETYHHMSHAGFLKTYLTARQSFYWVGMAADIQLFIKTCTVCQRIKTDRNATQNPMKSIEVSGLFERVHLDHHECRVSNCDHPYKHILIITDSLSLNTELCAAKTTTAEETALLFFENWICRYGCPKFVVTDKGKAFVSNFFKALCTLTSIKSRSTSPYHPQSNSVAEQRNRDIIRHLRAFCHDQKQWPKFLAPIAAAHRATVVTNLGVSPFYCMYGFSMPLNIHWELLDDKTEQDAKQRDVAHKYADQLNAMRKILQHNAQDCHRQTERQQNKKAVEHKFSEGSRVYLKVDKHRPGEAPKHNELYTGPFQCLEIRGDLAKLQHLFTGKILKNFVNVCKLREVSDDRDILYNRFRPLSSTTVQDSTAQQTPTDINGNTATNTSSTTRHVLHTETNAISTENNTTHTQETDTGLPHSTPTPTSDNADQQLQPGSTEQNLERPVDNIRRSERIRARTASTSFKRSTRLHSGQPTIARQNTTRDACQSPRDSTHQSDNALLTQSRLTNETIGIAHSTQATPFYAQAQQSAQQIETAPISSSRDMTASDNTDIRSRIQQTSRPHIDDNRNSQYLPTENAQLPQETAAHSARQLTADVTTTTPNNPAIDTNSQRQTTSTDGILTPTVGSQRQLANNTSIKLSPSAPIFVPRTTVLTEVSQQQTTVRRPAEQLYNAHLTEADDQATVTLCNHIPNTETLTTNADNTSHENTQGTQGVTERMSKQSSAQDSNSADNTLRQQFIKNQQGMDKQPSQHTLQQQQPNKQIEAIRGKRIVKRQAFYKVHFENDNEAHWLPAQEIPVQLLIDYNLKRYRIRRNVQARRRRYFDQ